MGSAKATALVVLTLAPAAAGCGAGDAARDAVDPVAEAADRTAAAGGARIDGAARFDFQGERFTLAIDGVVDFDDERSRFTVSVAGLGARRQEEAGFPLERLRDGLTMYASDPELRRAIGRQWAKVDLESIADELEDMDEVDVNLDAEALGGWDESNPRDLLRFLEAAGGARRAGAARIGGVATTRYDATVDVERYADLVLGDDADGEVRDYFLAGLYETMGTEPIPVSVWLDGDGLIRRERLEMRVQITPGESADATMRMDFEDFGPRHEVALPAEGDVRDVTGDWERYKVHFTG